MNKPDLIKLFVLVALIFLASFFRLYSLDSLPPGLNDDEAQNGLDALHLARGQAPALFYKESMGREPLHIYTQAVAIAFFGSRPWSLRLPSAVAGILTVPLLYLLATTLFGQGSRSRQIAFLATALLTVSYWHLHFSRIIFRAIYMVPLLILAVLFFWRGWQYGRRGEMVLAGVMLGLSFYTYLPARLMPFVILLFITVQYILARMGYGVSASSRKSLITAGAVMFAVALLIFTPLGFYFLQHPEQFIGRSQDVSIVTAAHNEGIFPARMVLEHTWFTVRMFIDQGHQNPLLNMPGRPSLNLLAAVGLLAGLVIALRRLAAPPYTLLLIWLPVMLLPTIFSDEPAHPLRAIGALPPVLLLAAVGLQRGAVWLSRALHMRPSRGVALMLTAVLIAGGVSSYRTYFRDWPTRSDTQAFFDVTDYNAAQQMLALTRSTSILLTERTFRNPTTNFVLESSSQLAPAAETPRHDLPVTLLYKPHACRLSQEMRLLQQELNGALTVYQIGAHELDVPAFLATADGDGKAQDRHNQSSLFSLTRLPAMGSPSRNALPHVVGANIAEEICLVAFDVTPAAAMPGDEVILTFYWEYLDESAPGTITGTARLIGADGVEIYHFPLSDFPGTGSGVGELFSTAAAFNLPAEMHPGKYLLQLDFTSNEGKPLGHATVGGLLVDSGQKGSKEPSNPLAIVAGDPPMFRLLGYDITPMPGSLQLVLKWQALRPIDRDYTVFIHLRDQGGEMLAQRDSEPMDGSAPTSWWLANEIVNDLHILLLESDLSTGNSELSLGLYYWQTGERLPLFDGAGQRLPDDVLTFSVE